MIKLIASDMDGSLLDEQGQLPPDFPEVLQELRQRGILFYVASGRTYQTLLANFGEMADQIGYICDNGAWVVENGVTSYANAISRTAAAELVTACRKLPGVQVVLSSNEGSFHLHCPGFHPELVRPYFIRRKTIQSIDEVNGDIYKIALCDPAGPEKHSYATLQQQFGRLYSIQISGVSWIDIMNKGVSKGKALADIQSRMTISPHETMAFGDFYNDIELLERASYSFVMNNANPDMKQHARFIAPDHRDHGVTQTIKKWVLNTCPL